MNVLPFEHILEPETLKRYFDDMKRWNFDVAYCAFYAKPWDMIVNEQKDAYKNFADEAHKRGYYACCQIQSTIAWADDVPLTEAQMNHDNKPVVYEHYKGTERKNFFASHASPVWRDFMKKVTEFYVKECGIDWIVYEEPMWIFDVPGSKDPLVKIFKQRYPDLEFPTSHNETIEYLKMQELKQDIYIEFYSDLMRHAKSVGAKKTGIMPWFFIPTYENTPQENYYTACDTAKFIYQPDLDFIVVRMQPDNIYAEAVFNDHGEGTPRVYFTETMAHSIGKQVIVVNNPTNEHCSFYHPDERLIPIEYFKECTLAALAAAPCGMTRHWYSKHYDSDSSHMDFMAEINRYLGRLGDPVAPAAFVFSFAGAYHSRPAKWLQSWPAYWNAARTLQFDKGMPMQTFFAGSLVECLEWNPEVRLLIFSDMFPVPDDEVALVERWLNEKPGRGILYFGSNHGYSYTPDKVTETGEMYTPPALFRLFGLDTDRPVSKMHIYDSCDIYFTGRDQSSAVLGENYHLKSHSLGIPAFSNKKPPEVIYSHFGTDKPVITAMYHQHDNPAVFVAGSLRWDAAQPPLFELVNAILGDGFKPAVIEADKNVLWSLTRNGYIVISNLNAETSTAVINSGQGILYNVREGKVQGGDSCNLEIPGRDFAIYRRVADPGKLVDIDGLLYWDKLREEEKKTCFHILSNGELCLKVLEVPDEIMINCEKIEFEFKTVGEIFEISLKLERGDYNIELIFEE